MLIARTHRVVEMEARRAGLTPSDLADEFARWNAKSTFARRNYPSQ